MIKRFLFYIVCTVGILISFVVRANEPDTQRTLFIPNAFTPNGDGMNDVFKVVNIESEEIQYFKVFNKWGTVMYESKEQLASWDGYYKGKLQEQGEYGFIIIVKFPKENNITKVYKGTIALIQN